MTFLKRFFVSPLLTGFFILLFFSIFQGIGIGGSSNLELGILFLVPLLFLINFLFAFLFFFAIIRTWSDKWITLFCLFSVILTNLLFFTAIDVYQRPFISDIFTYSGFALLVLLYDVVLIWKENKKNNKAETSLLLALLGMMAVLIFYNIAANKYSDYYISRYITPQREKNTKDFYSSPAYRDQQDGFAANNTGLKPEVFYKGQSIDSLLYIKRIAPSNEIQDNRYFTYLDQKGTGGWSVSKSKFTDLAPGQYFIAPFFFNSGDYSAKYITYIDKMKFRGPFVVELNKITDVNINIDQAEYTLLQSLK